MGFVPVFLIFYFQHFITMKDFKGDLGFLHSKEGHNGKPYTIPGTASGVTLDPGCDLGYVDKNLFEKAYRPLVERGLWTQQQYNEVKKAFGKKGVAAEEFLKNNRIVQTIRIPKKVALDLLDIIAEPYWLDTIERFPELLDSDVPPEVHTVALSLAYNRGPWNKHLAVLSDPIKKKDWDRYADLVDAMHNDTLLKSRRDSEADLIRNRKRSPYIEGLQRPDPKPPEVL